MLTRDRIRRFWALGGLVVLSLALSLSTVGVRDVQAAHNPGSPRIEAVYASTEIAPGDVWHIYLKGSDANENLRFIHVWVVVPGAPSTPIRLTVDRDQRGSLSGYLTLNSFEFGGNIDDLFGPPVYLRIMLESGLGRQSEAKTMQVSFYYGAKQPLPHRGFSDRWLGRIPVNPILRGGGGF